MNKLGKVSTLVSATLSFVFLTVPNVASAVNTYPVVARESFTASGDAWVDVPESDRAYLTTVMQINSASGVASSQQGLGDDVIQYLPAGEECLLAGDTVGFQGPALHWRGENDTSVLECSTDDISNGRDRSDVPIPFGFDIDFGGQILSGGYLIPAGGLVFSPDSYTYANSGAGSVFSLQTSGIVPFGADLMAYFFPDGSNISTEIWTAQTTIDGKQAFVVSWQNIKKWDTPEFDYSFQLVLISEADNAFTVWFNYDSIASDVVGYSASQVFVDLRDGRLTGSENEFGIYDASGVPNDTCTEITSHDVLSSDPNGNGDGLPGANNWSFILRNSSSVELYTDDSCATAAVADDLNGINYLNIYVSQNFGSVLSGWYLFDDTDPQDVRVQVTEIYPNVDWANLVDGATSELIGNSANTDVLGRYVYGISGNVVQGDNRLDSQLGVITSDRPVPTCILLPARSATVDGEVFLGGDFIELGLSAKGSWGTNGEAPSGFRGTPDEDNRLGFGSDLDGYCATPIDNTDLPIDFFVPGSAEERWAVGFEIDGVQYFGSFSELEGDISTDGVQATHVVTNETIGDLLSAKVISTITLDNQQVLKVTVTHKFAKTDTFFTSTVLLENLSGSSLTDVRYMRSFDPDNVYYQQNSMNEGAGFTTTNTIVSQVGGGSASVVEARLTPQDISDLSQSPEILGALRDTSGISTEIPILFYSKEPNSVAYVGGFLNPNPYMPLEFETGDTTDLFSSPQSASYTDTEDEAIGIIMRELSLEPREISGSLVYVTSLDYRDFGASTLAREIRAEVDIADVVIASFSEPEAEPVQAAPYKGPVPTGYSKTSPSVGDSVVISGTKLETITAITIDGVAISFSYDVETGTISLIVPEGLEPGLKDVKFSSSYGSLTSLRAFTVRAAEALTSVECVPTLNTGTFNGYIAVYAKCFDGKQLTWKIGGRWFRADVNGDYQEFQRKTIWTDYDVKVDIYIDGVKLVSKTVRTK